MKPLIIFGRSPFINDVNVPALITKYDTVGINYFAQSFPVKYSFTLMEYMPPMSTSTQTFGHWEQDLPGTVTKIAFRYSKTPFLQGEEYEGFPKMAWIGFTVGTVVNWALTQGYDTIYLVGIDHVETDKSFAHFDGKDDHRGKNMLPQIHQGVKQFIGDCQQYAKIYQCNPAVKDDWQLPYCEIGQL